ncbi:MAG: hypothetical protein EBZ49_09120 [Proteobacteria bacterium]|nr:hypothetical protein [Pseudomonadota bacterium]
MDHVQIIVYPRVIMHGAWSAPAADGYTGLILLPVLQNRGPQILVCFVVVLIYLIHILYRRELEILMFGEAHQYHANLLI